VGNLTWLQTLGLTAGTGLIGLVGWTFRQVLRGNLVPRATLDREKEISARWQEIANTYAETDRKRHEIITRNTEFLEQVLGLLERAPWVVTAEVAGSPGSTDSGMNRPRQIESRRPHLS
jgi:hypothetical protein